MVTPSARRAASAHMEAEHGVPQRRACLLVGVWRSTRRYAARAGRGDDPAPRMRDLARRHPRYGYRRVTALLRREGAAVNHKRVERLWRLEGLGLPRRRPRRRKFGPPAERTLRAERRGQVWSWDIVEDRTESGTKLRFLPVLDEHTRECHTIRVGRSMPSERVATALEELAGEHGAPEHVRMDNGPEFTARRVRTLLEERGSKAAYIEPGSPWQNPFIESFNGRFRDECLNREVFASLAEARAVAEAWRLHYNLERPHSSLGYRTPAEAAKSAGPHGARAEDSLIGTGT